MSDQIGNNNQQGMGGVQGEFEFYTPTNIPGIPIATPFTSDTMSISEMATESSNNMANPMNPKLQRPTYSEIAMQFQLGMAQITCDMLTAWNKSLQDEAERVKSEINSPKYQAWIEQNSSKYIAEQEIKAGKDLVIPTKSATEQQSAITTSSADEKDKFSNLLDRYYLIAGMSNLLSTTVQNIESTHSSSSRQEIGLTANSTGFDLSGYRPPEVVAASLAIGAGFVSNFSQVPDVASTGQVEVKTIQDAWNEINSSNDQITQTSGWFSAMWGIGLVYQLSAQNISEMGPGYNKGQPHKDLEFAKAYAQQLINSLEGNAFNISLLALLTPMLERSPETKAQENPANLALKGKCMLLAIALATLAILEIKSKNPNGKLTEEAFAAMITGNVDFTRDDEFGTAELKRQLVFYFNFNLKALPEEERVKVTQGILAYIGKNPKVEDLFDQQKIFSDIMTDDSAFEQTLIDKKPID